jgi:hypothetical protein
LRAFQACFCFYFRLRPCAALQQKKRHGGERKNGLETHRHQKKLKLDTLYAFAAVPPLTSGRRVIGVPLAEAAPAKLARDREDPKDSEDGRGKRLMEDKK